VSERNPRLARAGISAAAPPSVSLCSDTLACITGGIAEAYYQEIPDVSEKRKNKYFPFLFRKIKKQ
jgi:ADP-ribosylglycohydrolase